MLGGLRWADRRVSSSHALVTFVGGEDAYVEVTLASDEEQDA
jgi:hypothetical protein